MSERPVEPYNTSENPEQWAIKVDAIVRAVKAHLEGRDE